jgi:hypothetical protein
MFRKFLGNDEVYTRRDEEALDSTLLKRISRDLFLDTQMSGVQGV